MTITDSSTELSTTWTENTYVAFTAGTLATVADCLTEVQSKLKRGTLSTTTSPTTTEVYRWLIRAKQELAEVKGFTWRRRYAYCSTVASTYRYALPPDFNGGNVRIKDTTNDRFIELYDPHYFDSVYPDMSSESNDEPLYGCVKNMELWLAPPPSGVFTLEIEYDRSGDDNDVSSSADFSWLPEIERFRCCDFAVGEAFESLHMWEVSDRFKAKWGVGIGKAIRADGKRKWKSMNYRARSYQEQYDSLSYQPGKN
jgi:hypothetical protein